MRPVLLLIAFSAVWLIDVSDGAISCDNYNPDVCLPDLKGVCLANGTMMMGTCDAKRAICSEGAQEASDLACCAGTAQCRALNSATSHRPWSSVWLSVAGGLLLSVLRAIQD